MRKFLLVLSVLSASASTGALAQQNQPRSGTDAEQKACTRDVQKLCRNVMDQGDLVIFVLPEGKPAQDQQVLQ